ncbi:MAG: sensor histidine kinase, partial [Flavobacteriales bacterium]
MPYNEAEVKRLLQERVKELNCLYEISKICQNFELDLKTTLSNIVDSIPKGWQFENQLSVFLNFDELSIGEKPKNTTDIAQVNLVINQIKRGEIGVFYDSKENVEILEEERNLLEKIGDETSIFIERFEQKELEKEINSKLLQADRLSVLGELTAGIAHELNTPLGNILGYAELIKKTEKDLKNKGDVQKIITSAINAREIVKKLMYFSCEMPQQFHMIAINDQIKENIGLLDKQIWENNISLTLNLAENLPLIRLDKLQFSQIVFNLTLNAINAMSGKGEITISTFLEKNTLVFSIKDNGKGIEKENLIKVFQPFFTTNNNGKGTGLGLSVVHGLVQNHRAEITVD